MRRSIRRVAVAGLIAGAVWYPATAVQAAPAARYQAVAAASAALPAESVWLADVTVVTNQASAYLSTRLPDASVKAAIVLDIDNTSLETTYTTGLVYPATPPVLALALQAKKAGAAVFFVTARTQLIDAVTRSNLSDVGYPIDGMYSRPVLDFESNQSLKTNARIAIEKLGYTIVANVGNSATDLAGGHAERTFKLPDYDGALS